MPHPKSSTPGVRSALAVAGIATVVAATAWSARNLSVALGGCPNADRETSRRRSSNLRDGTFRNEMPATTFPPGTARQTFQDLAESRGRRAPAGTVPVVVPTNTSATPLPADGLHLTWYGHSSTLIEVDGRRILIDPVWSTRCSPSGLVGPRRMHPVPLPIDQLPPLDAIIISHDHYDHLDLATVRTLVQTSDAPFVVPLGVGAHLDRWLVPPERIIELDWNETARISEVTLTAAPARHFSGRGLSRDTTLWASWVIAGPSHRVFYSGDTGYFTGFTAIGAEHGPFDASLIQVGAYSAGWPDIHLTPEEGVRAHRDVRGGLLIPVHWATFNLAVHPWTDPADRIWREAKAHDVRLAIPRPGERVDVQAPPPVDGWWQALVERAEEPNF